MSEKTLTKEAWLKWRTETDSRLNQLAQQQKKPDSPGDKPPENKHLHTLNEQIDCPNCYPDLRKKVYDKEFKNADATCIECGLLAKKDNIEKEGYKCPNCGKDEFEARD